MVASLRVVSGPAQSGKTAYLLARYRVALKTGEPGTVLWLAPTWRAAAYARDRILGDGLEACWTPGVFTFDKFAQAILESAPASIRPLSSAMKRQLVRYLIDEHLAQGRLHHFRPIASTSGLVDLICELISEFKRLEIWPEDFARACESRGYTAKDRELLELYDAYQVTLREGQLYDAEGRFWSARDWLRQEQRKPFEKLRLVVADGFTDFTRTQHEILEQMAGWVEEIIISLPLESEPRRGDLFSKPLKTLSELQRRHRNCFIHNISRPGDIGDKRDSPIFVDHRFAMVPAKIGTVPTTKNETVPENASWPAMRHLEKNLFVNPRLVQPAASTEGIEILAAAKTQGEIELVGVKIKELIVDGVAKPGDIAVVFRSPQDTGGLAAEIFEKFGIPTAWETGQKLDRIPAMRALSALLQLDLDDWPFRELPAVLGSNYFSPDWPEWQSGKSKSIVEQTVRTLQIPHGRKALIEQLSNGSECYLSAAVLKRLAAAFDALPSKATLPQWAKAWEKLARETGLLGVIQPGDKAEKNERDSHIFPGAKIGTVPDVIAWSRLTAALLSGDTLAGLMNRRPPELDRKEAFQALVDILGNERMPIIDDESGRVRVLSATSIRSLEIPYLFLAGLSEKAFPPPDREDRLYSEAEYLQLIEKGLPLVARTERTREEMLLFYEALTRATRRLYLSYPALDESAQPLSPSPYLIEVEQACGKGSILRTEATDLRPIPRNAEPLSQSQFRVKAMAEAISPSGDVSLFAGLIQSDVANLMIGLETIILRQDRDGFGSAEGMLLGQSVAHLLSNEYSSNRCFTASELEQYATCPYRFLLQNILKLEPLEDITIELDALERGQIVHEVLASFHRSVNETLGHIGSPLELGTEEFDRLMQKALDESIPKPSSNPVRNALGEINRRLITQWLAEYREQYERYGKLWEMYDRPLVPELFEVSFGKTKHSQDSHSIEDPLEFDCGNDVVRMSGRIDRIDTGKVGKQVVFNVLDYKTGSTVKKLEFNDITRGVCLQLPIYAIAGAELLLNERDAIPWQAGYWLIRKDGFKPKKALEMYKLKDGKIELTVEWEEIRANLGKTINALVQGIRRGCFPVFNLDQYCTGGCPLNTICRIRQIRSMEKIWQPTQ